jgi:predicted RNA binding protein YcfA (HicA-like mRNA interferase family)
MVSPCTDFCMAKCDKLHAKAGASPAGLRFEELCDLAECFGFVFARQSGSHRLYKRPGHPKVMNFQNVQGMAKEYQVRQLLAAITDLTGDGSADEPL